MFALSSFVIAITDLLSYVLKIINDDNLGRFEPSFSSDYSCLSKFQDGLILKTRKSCFFLKNG
jgi:hypothetical protein